MSFVLDCSATLAVFLEDEQQSTFTVFRERLMSRGAVVPSLWLLEVANSLTVAMRLRRIDAVFRQQVLAVLRMMAIEIDEGMTETVMLQIMALADLHHLSVYDAAYLELAQRRHLPLATLDRQLLQAANVAGIAMIDLAA